MSKINQEEYEVLKDLDDKWKWIAKIRGSGLVAFDIAPKKYGSSKDWAYARSSQRKELDRNLLQFVEYDDDYPYSIAELIEEYESEDAEVKKDKEWLKEAILALKNKGNPENNQTEKERELGRAQQWAWNNCVDRAYELAKQLDEPETLSQEWIDENGRLGQFQHGGGIHFDYFVKARDLQNLLVPKHPTVEVQELINKYSIDTMSTYDVKVEREKFVNDLQNLLVPKREENNNELYRKFVEIVQMSPASAHDLLNTLANLVAKQHAYGTEKQEITEEQAWEVIHGKYGDELLQNNIDYVESQGYVVIERPTIPQFIADYLPLVKEDIELEKASYYAVTNNELPKWKREYDWIRENFETFARAWLAYPNIKVEKEQKYVVELLYGVLAYHQLDDYWDVFDTGQIEGNEEWVYQLTEQEIKDYDERYWAFRKPVEELEE